MIEFEVSHTPENLRRIYTAWWTRRYGRIRLLTLCIAVIAVTVMFVQRAMPWPAVIIATLAIAYAVFLELIRETATRHASAHLVLMGTEPLRFQFTNETLIETSAIGRTEVRWSIFDNIETIADAVLLTRKPREAAQFIVFPLNNLPVEAREFLQARFG
jgi:hypothetical protein